MGIKIDLNIPTIEELKVSGMYDSDNLYRYFLEVHSLFKQIKKIESDFAFHYKQCKLEEEK